jgi:hypothetical protein
VRKVTGVKVLEIVKHPHHQLVRTENKIYVFVHRHVGDIGETELYAYEAKDDAEVKEIFKQEGIKGE